ncbi:Ferredoxin II [Candidatus Hodgkinia cicadicola]|nr:Ferredoxin II [Candidatus Hodgkinia cicadicola]
MCRSVPNTLGCKSGNSVAISPTGRVDCGVCESQCSAGAIESGAEPNLEEWVETKTLNVRGVSHTVLARPRFAVAHD